MLEEGLATGALRAGIAPDRAALLLLSTLEGGTFVGWALQQKDTVLAAFEAAMRDLELSPPAPRNRRRLAESGPNKPPGGMVPTGTTIHQGSRKMTDKHTGTCFCGAVAVEVTGAPEAMGYCHCRSCRSWSAGPVNAFTLWKPENVKVTQGAEHVGRFEKTPTSDRQYCTKCGGHLMTDHPPFGLIDVYAATIPTLDFKPGAARQLRRDRSADEGRPAQVQGLPGTVRRLGRDDGRIGDQRTRPPVRGHAPGASRNLGSGRAVREVGGG